MKEQKYIVQKETHNEKGDKIYLCYFINKSENGRYGVGIDMYTQSANRRTEKETRREDDLFSARKEAEFFVNMISNGFVTPTTLADIAEDKKFEKSEKNSCI